MAHNVAVVLHLDADGARAVADALGSGDMGYRELHDAVDSWEAMRDA